MEAPSLIQVIASSTEGMSAVWDLMDSWISLVLGIILSFGILGWFIYQAGNVFKH